MATKAKRAVRVQVERERSQFANLIAQNPNYFGNLSESPFKPIKKIIGNTKYEQVTCVGYNPNLKKLEATIQIKLPFGYKGNLCQAGSTEYVRFFVDYGSGWVDAGVAAFNVHDIPNQTDCARLPTKPLTYVVTQGLDPKRDYCGHPVLPKVRAILSWEIMPPPNPNWPPTWGNVLDRHIQIKPRPWFLIDVVDLLSLDIGKKLEIPKELAEVQLKPIPLPDPPPLMVSDLVKLYSAEPASKGAKLVKTSVEPHRFGADEIHSSLSAAALNQEVLTAKIADWAAVGLDWASAVGAFLGTSGNVTYEQLDCLGLDYNLEWLVATFRIKKPTGYGGNLCQKGSKEHIAFWADWDDECEWTYLATVSVDVHDIATIPAGGLSYTAVLPVDLKYQRRRCDKPKIARVRAVLSWSTLPSDTDPDAIPHWGNRLDAHVQIRPGDPLGEGEVKPILWRVGGIRVENISNVTGLTTAAATFEGGFHPDLGSPFGNKVLIKGPPFPGFFYRVEVRNITSGGGWTTLADPLEIEPLFGPAYTKFSFGGYFTYETLFNNPDMVLYRWDTTGDDLWQIKLDIFGVPGVVTQYIRLKNSGIEDARINIDPALGGNCGKFNVGDPLNGAFVARDPYLSSYSLGTLPFAAPVGQLIPTGGTIPTAPAPPPPAPPPGGNPWTLNTNGMTPCGYVLVLSVVDKAILDSVPFHHHRADPTVGFCLEE